MPKERLETWEGWENLNKGTISHQNEIWGVNVVEWNKGKQPWKGGLKESSLKWNLELKIWQ